MGWRSVLREASPAAAWSVAGAATLDDAEAAHRRLIVRELHAAAATAAAKPHRGTILAAAAALDRCGSQLSTVSAVLGHANVVEAAIALRSQLNAPLIVVYGHELGDSGSSCWVVKVGCGLEAATAFALDLNSLAARYGGSIGKEDLVGLEPLERRELASHVAEKDPQVRVGRHGVRWSVDSLDVVR